LKAQMPSLMGKEKKQKKLINDLPNGKHWFVISWGTGQSLFCLYSLPLTYLINNVTSLSYNSEEI
jgi:hypothetical protein